MPLAEDQDVIEALAAKRADEPLRVWVRLHVPVGHRCWRPPL